MAKRKVVKGYVVKQEISEADPTTGVVKKIRKEVSRVYHSVSAAEAFLRMALLHTPDGDFYIHHKSGTDNVSMDL